MNRPIEPAWRCVQDGDNLRQELQPLIARRTGRERRIISLSSRASAYSSSHRLIELDVTLSDGRELRLIAKLVGAHGMLAEARRSRPSFLQHATREPDLYRTALQYVGPSAPSFYGTMCVGSRCDRVLVLERIQGLELRRIGEFNIWRQAAEVLGLLHFRTTHRLATLPVERRPPLLEYDHAWYWRWMARAVEHVCPCTTTDPKPEARCFRRIAEHYGPIVEHLASLPRLVIHGDCFPSNVLIEEAAVRARVCFVDWETASAGPGLMDVAALVSGAWTDREREEMLATYRAGLSACGGKPASLDEMRHDLARCRLHLAVQMLGWSTWWEPPSEQRQDWLREALLLASELNLL